MDNKIFMINKLPFTNPNHMKIESYSDNSEISNRVGDKADNGVFFIKEISSNYSNPNYTKSRYYNDNDADNNHNIRIRVGNEKLWLDNLLEGLE